ncbi:MAG: transposase [Candidatus Endonucleobacter bathymodioli]|uniref:Transposase n=1 Tax=Candidatus Endonucleibacter bathymodioli TaxID=539814 RepID=A0AA90P1H8_9GAMM|nr:transposase [Candidatus Endonucleobacter bathymodioli]
MTLTACEVIACQTPPLDPVYAIVYPDCIVVKIRQDKQVINKAIYLIACVNIASMTSLKL